MPRFFIEPVAQDCAVIPLYGEDALHISKSLRMRPGEAITLCDGNGCDYHCTIEHLDGKTVTLLCHQRTPNQSEPPIDITLFQALPKSDKMELITQKAVELGASRIVPVLTSRCISRPKPESWKEKQSRLQKVALEAAKQSGRGIIPQVSGLITLQQLLPQFSNYPLVVFLYEQAQRPLRTVLDQLPPKVALLVGSEGGFSPQEAEEITAAGGVATSLGPRILRCETAPLAALAALLYQAGAL